MNLALFDFDGTITTGDTFVPFLRYAVRPARAMVGAVVAGPQIIGYRLGLVSGSRARPAVVHAGFRGVDAAAVRALGATYARDVLPHQLRAVALERIRWHQQQGDRSVVVSASLDVYLAPWCEAAGVDCICTELEERDGRLTGRYRQGDCSGPAKAQRIRERLALDRFPTIYAYGDTPDDRDMLALADRKYYRWQLVDDRAIATPA